jgi:hypothetical protein
MVRIEQKLRELVLNVVRTILFQLMAPDQSIIYNNAHVTQYTQMLEARCPNCGKKAEVNDEMTEVKCRHCGFFASYDDYIEIMKSKAVDLSDNFQMSWDRNPF